MTYLAGLGAAMLLTASLMLSGCGEIDETRSPESTSAHDIERVDSTPTPRQVVPWPELDAATEQRTGGGEHDVAVIVAIESYDYATPIPGALMNGVAWQVFLTGTLGVPVENIHFLANSEATKESIQSALDRAAKLGTKGGRVWFVFIGHGAPRPDRPGGMLLGADVRATTNSIADRGLSHKGAIRRLEKSAALPVAILDTCYSGRTGDGEAVVEGVQPLSVVSIPKSKRALVFSAARGDQYAGPLPGRARPAFSYLLLGALRGWGDGNADGIVTAEEALSYSARAMRAVVTGREQTPGLVGDGGKALTLSAGEAAPNLAEIQRLLTRGSENLNRQGVVLVELPELKLEDVSREGLGALDLDKIDIAAEKRLEQRYLALERAKRRVEVARKAAADDPSGEKQRSAWCSLAQLASPNPYKKAAERACSQARVYVEQRKRLVKAMKRDWEEIVVPFLSLRHRTLDEKTRVVRAFVETYGALETHLELKSGAAALKWLNRARLPQFVVHRGTSVLGGVATGPIKSDMIVIPGGRFGKRRIADFAIDRTEVTVGQYRSCVEATVCRAPRPNALSNYEVRSRIHHPINDVSALDARSFCAWAGKRLPTELEWEWTARGREEGRIYPWGAELPTCERAVLNDGRRGCGKGSTWSVGSRSAGRSRDGVMDMLGNVWEWTATEEPNSYAQRGGGWFNEQKRAVRVTSRRVRKQTEHTASAGFRCAVSLADP